MSVKTRLYVVNTMCFPTLFLFLFLFMCTSRESFAAPAQDESSSQTTVTFTGTVSVNENVAFTSTGNLDPGRFSHTATKLLDGKVLVAGGRLGSPSAGSSLANLYDPVFQTFLSIDDMREARRNHTATYPSPAMLLLRFIFLLSSPIYIVFAWLISAQGNSKRR